MVHMRLFPNAWRDMFLPAAERHTNSGRLPAPEVLVVDDAQDESVEGDNEEDDGDGEDDDSEMQEGDDDVSETDGERQSVSASASSSSANFSPVQPYIRQEGSRATREQELGSEFQLTDCTVTVSAWVERFCAGRLEEVFMVDVRLTSGASWCVEKLAIDFLRLRRHLPTSAAQLSLPTLPVKKKLHRHDSDHDLSVAVEDRRRRLQAFINNVVSDNNIIYQPHANVVVNFLRRRSDVLATPSPLMKEEDPSGQSLRRDVLSKARWHNCWTDILVSVETDCVNFYCNHIKVPHCVVHLWDITSVRILEQRPFSSHTFCEVATDTTAYYLFSQSEELMRAWVQTVTSARQKALTKHGATTRPVFLPLSQKSTFKPDADVRMVLNNHRLSWNQQTPQGACLLSSQLLKSALELYRLHASTSHLTTVDPSVRQLMLKFANDVAELQCCPITRMTEPEKICFFCNVYHILSVHAFIELGDPGNLLRRRAYNMSVSYDIDGRLFSLIEIEHCVLRAPMSKPQVFWSSLVIPRFSKKDLRCDAVVTRSEPRLNFVLDAGTYSSPYFCWRLDVEQLDVQLDHAAQHFLKDEVHVNLQKRVVTLPRVCQWYGDDMGSSNLEMLRYVVKFMPMDQGQDLQRLLDTHGSIKIRYSEYDWKQRGWLYAGDNHFDSCSLSQPSRRPSMSN